MQGCQTVCLLHTVNSRDPALEEVVTKQLLVLFSTYSYTSFPPPPFLYVLSGFLCWPGIYLLVRLFFSLLIVV